MQDRENWLAQKKINRAILKIHLMFGVAGNDFFAAENRHPTTI